MEENKNLLTKILNTFSSQEGLDDLLIMSEHWDGHKRENAVRRLGMLGNPIAIPKLIVRANDWVPQVRAAARKSLQKLLKNDNAAAFVLSLPALYHLQYCGRDDHSQLISHVISFLLQPDNSAYIRLAIKNTDPYLARLAFNLCLENALIDKKELVSKCLSHRDVVVRNRAAGLLRDFSGETLDVFLQQAIQDPFMPIRREAFQIYLRVTPAQGLELANRLLFDPHISIREIAIRHLSKNEADVALILTHALSSSNQSALKIRCAILGLAEIGSKQSIPKIIEFTRSALPSIRKAALQALTKLIGDDARSYLLSALKDESPSVAKESSRLFAHITSKLSDQDLLSIVEEFSYHHTLTVCLSSAKMINKWDRLAFLLAVFRLLMLRNSNQSDIVNAELSQWDIDFNHTSSQPSRLQIERIRVEYDLCKHLLNEGRRELLAFTIRNL